jgi:hypothetical protein
MVSEVSEQGIDLLALGHGRKHDLSDVFFGSTMRYVAHHAPCKVIVQISAPDAREHSRILERARMLVVQTELV